MLSAPASVTAPSEPPSPTPASPASLAASAPASPASLPPPSTEPSTPPSVIGRSSQRPISSVVDEQTISLTQPLPPVPRQPGTHREVEASQTRPEVTLPQSASARQPQRPSVRHWLPASSGRHWSVSPGAHSTHFFLVASQTSGASQSVVKRHCTQRPSLPPLRSQWVSGWAQSASMWQSAPEHWPTPFVTSRQFCPVGQPLRGDGPQPGTQKPPAPLQMRPESEAPQERSSVAPAQPQMPRSATQTGFTPPHSVALVPVHSVHAPRSGPVR
jgi:hypothetical protein